MCSLQVVLVGKMMDKCRHQKWVTIPCDHGRVMPRSSIIYIGLGPLLVPIVSNKLCEILWFFPVWWHAWQAVLPKNHIAFWSHRFTRIVRQILMNSRWWLDSNHQTFMTLWFLFKNVLHTRAQFCNIPLASFSISSHPNKMARFSGYFVLACLVNNTALFCVLQVRTSKMVWAQI